MSVSQAPASRVRPGAGVSCCPGSASVSEGRLGVGVAVSVRLGIGVGVAVGLGTGASVGVAVGLCVGVAAEQSLARPPAGAPL